jgi:hypothetical protein
MRNFAFEKPVDDKMKFNFIFLHYPDIRQSRRRVLSKHAAVNFYESRRTIQKRALENSGGRSHGKKKNSLSVEIREFLF